jgi:hypothetical protein
MLKLLVTPLLLITMNQKKEGVIKSDYEKNPRFIERMREQEQMPKTKLFIKNLEYQLLYDSIDINYSLIGCFNYNYYRMTIKKNGHDFYMNFFTIMAPDMKMAEEMFLKDRGSYFLVKLSKKDIENLKNALVVDKRWRSTMHNYISIRQGDLVYELMDNNPEPSLIYFIEGIRKRGG